ncbi:MAG: hypothetical protein F6K07_33110 [Okeania sp. SIO1H5]|uniref:PD-(D/E)XK nuclease superfamily protein n=1 Tax=Okeania sp. SIO1H5 TaxID=2607777 RepID=UPI0013B6F09A|nr:PD-(D/E)XK nuclease superfamily protein [Okeania sp. SIO1H5]NET23833.1 hypothetical protein [Okeania sp. SIO1H5]
MLTGNQYCALISDYLLTNFSVRGIRVYREVNLGKTIIGKNRRIDLLVIDPKDRAFAIECKYQDVRGTTDEKLPYALGNMESLPIPGCIVYAGQGFSEGVLHLLQASEIAAYCLPQPISPKPSRETRELDHLLAMRFRWWDVVLSGKKEETIQGPGQTDLFGQSEERNSP